MSAAQPLRPYGDAAMAWYEHGWSPLPLPPRRKAPVPTGTTGYKGERPDIDKVEEWINDRAEGNVAIRLPDGVVGIDVDHYGDKTGDDTLADIERDFGSELPPTIRTSARGTDNPSGIRWFTVPPGTILPTVLGPGIEVIQHFHRYAVVWPSWNPKSASQYQCINAENEIFTGPFTRDELSELPQEWIEFLQGLDTSSHSDSIDKSAPTVSESAALAWISDRQGDGLCRAMRATLNKELARLEAAIESGDSRYESARDGAMAVVALSREGHHGVRSALAELRTAYEDAVADERNRDRSEWKRLVIGAVSSVAGHEVELHDRRCPDRERPNDELWPSPAEPYAVAERFLAENLTTETGHSVLRAWKGDLWRWRGTHWSMVSESGIRSELYRVLSEVGYWSAAEQPIELAWKPDKTKISKVIDALAHHPSVYTPDEFEPALSGAIEIAFTNGVLVIDDDGNRELVPHSPERFNFACLPFDYSETDGQPVAWLSFLDSLQLDDDEIELLRQWFGYVISGDMRKHKMMLLLGPTRAGKGVITRTLQRLIGHGNYVSASLDQFAQNFGLQSCIGKSLITIADARFGGQRSKAVIERMLNISGCDDVVADRKNKEPWSGVLPGRIMVVSNELPALTGEASSALAERFIGPIELHRSFLGAEDEMLEERLRGELGSIMLWALEGYDDLCERGRFTAPKAALSVRRELAESLSPMVAFLEECCELDENAVTASDELYEAYRRWSDQSGRGFIADKIRFTRDLRVSTNQNVWVVQPRSKDGKSRYRAYQGIRLVSGNELHV